MSASEVQRMCHNEPEVTQSTLQLVNNQLIYNVSSFESLLSRQKEGCKIMSGKCYLIVLGNIQKVNFFNFAQKWI